MQTMRGCVFGAGRCGCLETLSSKWHIDLTHASECASLRKEVMPFHKQVNANTSLAHTANATRSLTRS